MPDEVYGEPPSPEAIAALVAVMGLAIDRYVKNRARRTIVENAKADPAKPKCRWVVEADACDFCKARGSFWVDPGETPIESHGGCKCHLDMLFAKNNTAVYSEEEWKPKNDPRTREEIMQAIQVSFSKVESKEYDRKMRRLVGARADSFCGAARKALKHRDSTLMEDLYAINLETGQMVAVTNSKTPKSVRASRGMKTSVAKWKRKGQRFATLHNHPESLLPSPDDLASLLANGAEYGIIACHDGSLFKYSIVNKALANRENFEKITSMYYMRIGNHGEPSVFNTILRETGVLIEHIA